MARHRRRSRSSGSPSGRRPPTGDQAEMEWTPSRQRVAGGQRRQRRVPRRRPVPARRPVLRRAGPPRAAAADVIVVNTHLYGLDVASGGAILPEHDVVVFDEAHVLEDVMSDTVGVEIAPGRFTTLAGVVRRIVDDPQLIGSIAEIAESLRDALGAARRATPVDPRCPTRSTTCSPTPRLGSARRSEVLVGIYDRRRGRQATQAAGPDADRPGDRATRRRDRGPATATWPSSRVRRIRRGSSSRRSTSGRRWRRGCGRSARPCSPARRSRHRWRHGSACRRTRSTTPTSAARSTTTAHSMLLLRAAPAEPEQRRLPAGGARRARGADHRRRRADARPVHQLAVDGRGGRGAVARACRFPILTQRDLPKPALVKAFADSAETCLFATAGPVPGRRRAGLDPVARRDRPHPVPPPRRSAAVGAARATRARRRSPRSTSRGRR